MTQISHFYLFFFIDILVDVLSLKSHYYSMIPPQSLPFNLKLSETPLFADCSEKVNIPKNEEDF